MKLSATNILSLLALPVVAVVMNYATMSTFLDLSMTPASLAWLTIMQFVWAGLVLLLAFRLWAAAKGRATPPVRTPDPNENLHLNERTAYELTENIPVGTYTMVQPPDGGLAFFSFMSTRFLEITGLEREEARSHPFKAFECVHPDDREEWVRKNVAAFEKKAPFKEECRVIIKGEVRWVLAESRPRDLCDGSVVWEGVLIDITDRKNAEAALLEANRSMRIAAAATQLGFWDLDVATGLETWDENMCRLHGLKPGEFDGRAEAFYAPEDREMVQQATKAMLESDYIYDLDYRIIRKDGELRHIRGHAISIRDSSGRPLRAHGTAFDITDEVMASQREREMEQAYREKLESKLKSSLVAAAIGHEINTPLSTLLLQENQSLSKGCATADELQVMARETRQVLRIIEKMKVLMRNVQTDHVPVNLRGIIDSALLQVKRSLQSHDILVQSSYSAGDHLTVAGDDAQIQLAIVNILRNAIEAVAENPPDRPREIQIELKRHNRHVRLSIGDSGRGFAGVTPDELLLNTTKETGTGIGLYIVQTMAQNHHAELTFGQSCLGGAEVTLLFPAQSGRQES